MLLVLQLMARRNGATILVGAPGAAQVYAFVRRNTTEGLPLVMNEFGNVTLQNKTEGTLKWTLEAILEHPDAIRAKHNFGGRGLLPLTATARSSALRRRGGLRLPAGLPSHA